MSITENPIRYVEIARSKSRGLPTVWEHSPGRFSDQDPCAQVVCNHSGQRLHPILKSDRVSQGRSILFGLRKEFFVVRVDPKNRDFNILRVVDEDIYDERFGDKVDIVEGESKFFGNLDEVEFVAKEDLRLGLKDPIRNIVSEQFKEALQAAEKKITELGAVFYLTREQFDEINERKRQRSDREQTKRPWAAKQAVKAAVGDETK